MNLEERMNNKMKRALVATIAVVGLVSSQFIELLHIKRHPKYQDDT